MRMFGLSSKIRNTLTFKAFSGRFQRKPKNPRSLNRFPETSQAYSILRRGAVFFLDASMQWKSARKTQSFYPLDPSITQPATCMMRRLKGQVVDRRSGGNQRTGQAFPDKGRPFLANFGKGSRLGWRRLDYSKRRDDGPCR